jgi:hypothetical protein
MRIIKNICESLVDLLLNIHKKSKDGVKARKYTIKMRIRPELASVSLGKWTFLPPAYYTLSKKEKLSLLACLKSIKIPTDYSLNISKKVSIKE